MTREELEMMEIEDIDNRREELRKMVDAPDADLDAIDAEVDIINEVRSAKITERETRKAEMEEVLEGKGKMIEEKKESNTMEEIRNTKSYIDAYAKYVRTGSDKECRALLTENVNGTVPVPDFVYGIVAERVKESRILSRVRRMTVAGNVKVGFEIEAPEAAMHAENAAAVAEEALTLGIVTLIPGNAKKWVQFSTEVMENSEAFLTYIYDEITRGIIKAREKAIIDAILAAPATASATAPAVPALGKAVGAITDIIEARALLSGAADEIVVIVNPADYAKYKGFQMAANYGADPFDGHEVIVSEYATAPIVGDLAGAMENLPEGDGVKFILDETTLMTSDMIRLLGRTPVASAVVGNKFFAVVKA